MRKVFKPLANLEFANILAEAVVNTATGQSLVNKYREHLLVNESTCSLVNSFIREAKNCLYDKGIYNVCQKLNGVIDENKVSWQLASVCESINNNQKSYNYLQRNAVKQVQDLLEMNEDEVVKYIKAGALKNVMFVESIRNVVRQVYKNNMVVENVSYNAYHPMSLTESNGDKLYFEVLGKVFAYSEDKIEEAKGSDVSNEFKLVSQLLESNSVRYENETLFVNALNAEYQISEAGKCVRLGNNQELELTTEQLREHNRMLLNTVNRNKINEAARLLESIALLVESFDKVCILDSVQVVSTNNDKFVVIENKENVISYSLVKKWAINESFVDGIKFIKETTKVDLSESYTENIEKSIAEKDTEEREAIKESLRLDEENTRKKRIEALIEKYKHDEVKLGIISQLAQELNEI